MIRTKPKAKKPRAVAPIDPAKLKGYVERIERVELEQKEAADAKKDIYTEVKAAGMRPKMVRKIVKERAKKDEDAAEAAELERYRAALAMPGATYRSVAAKVGVPRSTLHRLVPREKNGTGHAESSGGVEGHAQPAMRGAERSVGESKGALAAASPQAGVEPGPEDTPHDPETGEITTIAGPGPVTSVVAQYDPAVPATETAAAPIQTTERPAETPGCEISPAVDTAAANTGGGHEVAEQHDSHIDDEPCGQAAATVSAVGDERVSAATPGPQVPDDDWDSIAAEQQRLNEARRSHRERSTA